MKNIEQFTDLISIIFGAAAAFLKSLKLKLTWRTVVLSVCIAGVIAYGTIGFLTLYFKDISPKLMVLASFCIGWVSNELTTKLDSFVNDIYDILLARIKSIFKK